MNSRARSSAIGDQPPHEVALGSEDMLLQIEHLDPFAFRSVPPRLLFEELSPFL